MRSRSGMFPAPVAFRLLFLLLLIELVVHADTCIFLFCYLIIIILADIITKESNKVVFVVVDF